MSDTLADAAAAAAATIDWSVLDSPAPEAAEPSTDVDTSTTDETAADSADGVVPAAPAADDQAAADEVEVTDGDLADDDEEDGDEIDAAAELDDAEETTQQAPEVVTLAPDTIVTVDGKTGPFGELAVSKAEFTRKSQEAAAEKAAIAEERAYIESVKEQAREFLSSPFSASMQALLSVTQSQGVSPEAVTMRLIKQLNAGGHYTNPAFLEALGLDRPDNIVEQGARVSEAADKTAELEAQIAELKAAQEAKVSEAEAMAEVQAYEASMVAIAREHGLDFGGDTEAAAAWSDELWDFAVANNLLKVDGKPDLSNAYLLMEARKAKAAPAVPAKTASVGAGDALATTGAGRTPTVTPEAKAATRKVAAKSAPAARKAPEKADSLEEAAARAAARIRW